MSRMRVGVLGGGSWGTTVASLAAATAETTLWARNQQVVEDIEENHRNSRYLGDLALEEGLRATTDMAEALDGADIVVGAIPSHGFRDVIQQAAEHIGAGVPVISVTKGLEQESRKRMTEIVAEALPDNPAGALAGPNIAKEVLQGYAAAATLAMPDEEDADDLQEVFGTRMFRVYRHTDVLGVELCGAVKNVLSIATGMGDGAGAGENTRAMLITRGMREMIRLGTTMGGREETFAGLPGMGDVIVTCVSAHSRNHHVGEELARGKTRDQIVDEMDQVAEGIKNVTTILELAEEHDVEMPIVREVDAVVNHGSSVGDAYRRLLETEPSHEIHGEAP